MLKPTFTAKHIIFYCW